MQKLYIVTRANLPAGLQIAQCCHALQSFNDQHPELATRWEGNIVILAAKDLSELSTLTCELSRSRHRMACFHEPDIGGELCPIPGIGRCESSVESGSYSRAG